MFVLCGAAFGQTVATPTCTLAANSYVGTQSTSCSTSTAGASLYYSTSGTPACPSTGTLYLGPLYVVSTETLNVIGCLTGDTPSSVASYAYTITPQTSCGPPSYPCSTTSTTPVGTLPLSFSTTTPYNTVVFSALNPTLDPITRFTDQNIVQYGTSTNLATRIGSGNLTNSADDLDNNTSLSTQYVMIRANGGPDWIFQTSIVNGALQNSTNGGENPSLGVPATAFSFSRVSEGTYYYLSGNSLYQATINPGTPMTSTVTSNSSFPFDIGNCPAASSTPASWFSSLTVSKGDSVFMFSVGWVGGQGFAHLSFAYSPTLGCSALDLAPNGTSSTFGNWYAYCVGSCSGMAPSGTEATCIAPNYSTGSGIHDTYSSADGSMESIDTGCWSGGGGSPAYWQINTGNVVTSSLEPPPTGELAGGHKALGLVHLVFTNNPTPNNRVINPLNNANIANYTPLATFPPGSTGTGGLHGGWQAAQNFNDTNYWLIESACGGPSYTPSCGNYLTPNAYQNEVDGISVAGIAPITRFAPTYNSGQSTYFSCNNGIGFGSQDGQWWFWLADGLLNIGTDTNGKPLCSVFAVHLDGSGSIPPPPTPTLVGPAAAEFAKNFGFKEASNGH
jgi:hypothetical protein